MAIRSLAKKLKIKDGTRIVIINAPQGFLDEIKPLPQGVELVKKSMSQFDFAQLFVHNSAKLEKYLPDTLIVLNKGSTLWISFLKRSSKLATRVRP